MVKSDWFVMVINGEQQSILVHRAYFKALSTFLTCNFDNDGPPVTVVEKAFLAFGRAKAFKQTDAQNRRDFP